MTEVRKGMTVREKGLVFIVSAPSGAGKTTLLRAVMARLPGLQFSVSHTTRPPRANEREGEDYYFVSPSIFQEMVERDEFLEWAEVSGNRYGTARAAVEGALSSGTDVLLDVDTQGAGSVRRKLDRTVLIFILPPSMKVLEERLINRGLDSPEMIRRRMAGAKKEMQEAHWYDYVIVNEEIEETIEKLRAIIVAERCRQFKNAVLRKMKREWEERHGEDYR
jgi:guanylate kinase